MWLKIREDDVRINHERGSIPDPSRYFVKDYPGGYTAIYPEVTVIAPRYTRPVYILLKILPPGRCAYTNATSVLIRTDHKIS